MQRAKPRQRLFAFMYKKKPKERIQLLNTPIKNSRVFKLRNKLLVEYRNPASIVISQIKPEIRNTRIAHGNFDEDSSTLTGLGLHLKSNPPKKTAVLHYAIDKQHSAYLNKGIATEIVKSLIGMAKKAGYERAVAECLASNTASHAVLRHNKFLQIPNTTIWYRGI